MMQRLVIDVMLIAPLAVAAPASADGSDAVKALWETVTEQRTDQEPVDERYRDKARADRERAEKARQQRDEVERQVANANFITCPVDKLRTEVVSDLPRGWWQTPQVGNLVDTRIQNIGGRDTLVCAYRGYGGTVSVMREAPAGSRCRARTDGFSCY